MNWILITNEQDLKTTNTHSNNLRGRGIGRGRGEQGHV